MASSPKKAEKTAEEVAVESRQRTMLNSEIEETEDKLKAVTRGTLGRASMLAGAPASRAGVVNKPRQTGMIKANNSIAPTGPIVGPNAPGNSRP